MLRPSLFQCVRASYLPHFSALDTAHLFTSQWSSLQIIAPCSVETSSAIFFDHQWYFRHGLTVLSEVCREHDQSLSHPQYRDVENVHIHPYQ